MHYNYIGYCDVQKLGQTGTPQKHAFRPTQIHHHHHRRRRRRRRRRRIVRVRAFFKEMLELHK